jgi:hypothetical protein
LKSPFEGSVGLHVLPVLWKDGCEGRKEGCEGRKEGCEGRKDMKEGRK